MHPFGSSNLPLTSAEMLTVFWSRSSKRFTKVGTMKRRMEVVDISWSRQPGQDGRTYIADVKVNGASFRVAVEVSETVQTTECPEFGRAPTEQDWEAVVMVKTAEAIENGYLDDWPPRQIMVLPAIQYGELDLDWLVRQAKRKGLITQANSVRPKGDAMAQSKKSKTEDTGFNLKNLQDPPSPNHPKPGQSIIVLLPKGASRESYLKSVPAAKKRQGL